MSAQPGVVPKFGSFKPKQASTEKKETGKPTSSGFAESTKPKSSHHDRAGDASSKERREARHLEEHSRHRHHHRRHHRSRSRERARDKGSEVEIRRDEAPIKTSIPLPVAGDGLFVIDKRGDENNLVYGSQHRYNIPNFRRYGNGSVLGCPKDLKIDRDLSDEKKIVLSDYRNRFPAKREKHILAKGEKRGIRLLKIRPESQSLDTELNVDFLPLLSKTKAQKQADIDDGFLSDDDQQHYRSIEGKAKQNTDPRDDDFQYETDASSDVENGRHLKLDSSIRTRNIELSREVEKNPRSVNSWLQLIDHQDKLLGFGENGSRKITQAERRSTAEIKVHMYEKALRQVDPTSALSIEQLSIGLMDEGSKVWDARTLTERWEDMTRKHPHSIVLWKKYVDFRQTNFSTFGYEEHRGLFAARAGFLRDLIVEGTRSEAELNGLYQSFIYTLVRATLFMREAGFQELAIGIWQGILEFNFCSPSNIPVSEMGELFRDFWESEVPRIGEAGSMGWNSYVENPSSTSIPEPRCDTELSEIARMGSEKVLFGKWAAAERKQSKDAREPARTMDDVTENDPYRLILFNDIEPFLIRLPTETNSDLGRLVFNAFLTFSHLTQVSLPHLYNPTKAWREDSFLRNEILDYNTAVLQHQLEVADGDLTNDRYGVFHRYPIQSFVSSPETMFAGAKWYRSLHPWISIYGDDSGPTKYEWVRNALRTLSTKDPSFAEYHLAFEFTNNPETIKKTAKTLLKRYPSSLALYNAYALIEWNQGHQDIAKTVFFSALGLSTSLSETEQANIFLLRKSYVWALLEDGKPNEALQQLLGTGIVNISPAAILKSRQELLVTRDHLVSSGQFWAGVTITELLAILEYYTASLGTRLQGNIAEALAVFSKFSDVLFEKGMGKSNENELLHQSAARLLYFYAKSGPHRPATIRQYLTNFITIFPQNTLLLSLLSQTESHSFPLDKTVRSLLLTKILVPGTVPTHFFAIRHEILHGNIHSQNAAFEHALGLLNSGDDGNVKNNPGIWRLYLQWCLRTKGYEKRVRDLFFRAVAACPCSKGLLLEGFEGGVMEVLGGDDLKGVYKVLMEKELRVHVDMEEVLEGEL